jgi:hypothetical protein
MANFYFKTNLIAVMRVRASDETVARKVVPTALRGPNAVEIRLANEGAALLYEDAIVTNVDFSVEEGSIELIETVRMSELPHMTAGSKRALATRSRRGRAYRRMQMQAGRSPQSFHGALAVASARAVHANPNRSVRHTSPKFRCAKTQCDPETCR